MFKPFASENTGFGFDFVTPNGSLEGCMDDRDYDPLQVGSYSSAEGDLGDPTRPFLGFGLVRRAQRLEREAAALRARADRVVARGRSVQTGRGTVRYISPDQLESWASAEWGFSEEE